MINRVDSTSFSGIYKNPYMKFSRTQDKTVQNIVDKLRTPDENGKTTEDKFAQKNSHFFIEPAKNNTVDLYIFEKSKFNKTEDYITYKDKINVGTYGEGRVFKLDDVDKILNDKKKNSLLSAAVIGCAGLLALMVGFCSSGNKNTGAVNNGIEKNIIQKDTVNKAVNAVKTKIYGY